MLVASAEVGGEEGANPGAAAVWIRNENDISAAQARRAAAQIPAQRHRASVARGHARRKKEFGGEGSRTPVLEAFSTSFYMFIRCLFLRSQTMHRHTAGSRASAKSFHPSTRSLRRQASLLSMSRAVAGVQPGTSRSIKPRERDLGDLRLFVLVRILTRPTNHPRHAACTSINESKPVRPRILRGEKLPDERRFSTSRRAGENT